MLALPAHRQAPTGAPAAARPPAPTPTELAATLQAARTAHSSYQGQCDVVHARLSALVERAAPAERAPLLASLLDATLALPVEDTEPVLFTVWFDLAHDILGRDAVVNAALEAMAARGTDALTCARLLTRLVVQLDPPAADLAGALGPVIDWLLAQPALVRAQGLEAVGRGLGSPQEVCTPEHACALLALVGTRAEAIEAAGAWPPVKALLDRMAGDAGLGLPQALTVVETLGRSLVPGRAQREAMLKVLARTLPAHALPLSECLNLPGLDAGAWQRIGRCLGQHHGGEALDPAWLARLTCECIQADTPLAATNALLAGVLASAGGSGLATPALQALSGALSDAQAQAQGPAAMQAERAQALQRGAACALLTSQAALDLADPSAWATATTGLAWLAVRDLDLALAAAGALLPLQAPHLDAAQFDELLAPLLAQALAAAGQAPVAGAQVRALCELHVQFARSGRLAAAPAPVRRRGPKLSFGPASGARPAAPGRAFLRDRAQALERGPGSQALASLACALAAAARL